MSKEELEINPNKIVNDSSETDTTKNLCVHDLTRRLKNKQRKKIIIKVIIFSTLIVFIGVIFFIFLLEFQYLF